MLRQVREVLHGGDHHPVPDRRHGRLPRLHRPERLFRLRHLALAGDRGPRAPAPAPGGALLHPLAVLARALQHPRRRVHRAGRGHRGQAGPAAPGRERHRRPDRRGGALGHRVRLRLRRVLLRGVLHDARPRGVHGRPEQVQERSPPGHRWRHRRLRLLRRMRVPRLQRRHHGHHHPQPPDQLVHRRRQGGAVRRAGVDIPDHDAPDPRDRGGAAVGVSADARRRRRRRRGAGGGAGEPRGGAGGAVGDGVLRAGVRVVRVLRGENGVCPALFRAPGALPPPRRGRRRRDAARRGLGNSSLRARVRRPRVVHCRVAALILYKIDTF